MPEAAGLYLVAWQIDAMTSEIAEDALRHLQEQMDAVLKAHDLNEEDIWGSGAAPPEYEELRQQYMDAWDELYAQKLKDYGEPAMADLFRSDRDEFESILQTGREFFHGPRDDDDGALPEWLGELVAHVAVNMESDGVPGPLGMQYEREDGFWQVTVYPQPVEVVGGADDGAVVNPGFILDLEELRSIFEKVVANGWKALGGRDSGSQLFIEGVFQGREVLLSVLAEAPEDEEPRATFAL